MCFSLPASADTAAYQQIKGEKNLRAVFEKTMMVGEYRTYRDETRTYNYTEYHNGDGTTDYREGKLREKGNWNIVGDDKVCYKYPKSDYYEATYCFFVFKQGDCYYKHSLRNMTPRGPRRWKRWSSRAIRKNDGGSCAAPVG